MPSKSAVSLENVMEVLKTIQQTQSAHTEMLNKLASGKKATASSSNETTEANNKTTTKSPTIDALLKEILTDSMLNFRGCVAGTHSNPSIWPFKADSEFVAKYKDDDKKFITELKKKLDKDESKKLKALLTNKENYGTTTKISKKAKNKDKKEESSDSDSDSVPASKSSKSKPKPKAKGKQIKKVESDDEEDEEDSN